MCHEPTHISQSLGPLSTEITGGVQTPFMVMKLGEATTGFVR
jgi:hypothetical protein